MHVYGQIPSDIHQPAKGSPAQHEAKEIDKCRNRRVRGVTNCQECLKLSYVFALSFPITVELEKNTGR